MRNSRREKQNTRRRQEQEYRDKIPVLRAPIITIKKNEPAQGYYQATELTPYVSPRVAPPEDAKEPESTPKTNYALVTLAYSLGLVGLGINAWFAWNRGSTLPDKVLLSSLGFIAEAVMFFLLSQAKALWVSRQRGSFFVACTVWPVLFIFALTNSLGFASFNLAEANTVRAERITPAVADAQRRLDILSASRAAECLKRGDKCRQLEKEEQSAMETLAKAREVVSATSDPQIASAAKLIAWVSQDRFHPSADDFAMLRLLLLTFLPQLGGLVLMVAKRA